MIKLKVISVLSVLVFALVSGCASNPPVDKALILTAEQRVQQAKDDQAYEHAPLEIKNAEKYLLDARLQNERGETVKAKRNFELSVAEAEHALAKTRSVKAEKAADEIKSGLDSLRRESTK